MCFRLRMVQVVNKIVLPKIFKKTTKPIFCKSRDSLILEAKLRPNISHEVENKSSVQILLS